MSNTASEDAMSVEQWLQIRKEAGLKIDPETAEVDVCWGYIIDPYGIDEDIPEDARCVGRLFFARSPGSSIWVSFHDLPRATLNRIYSRSAGNAVQLRSDYARAFEDLKQGPGPDVPF